jgi:hypothetical protein
MNLIDRIRAAPLWKTAQGYVLSMKDYADVLHALEVAAQVNEKADEVQDLLSEKEPEQWTPGYLDSWRNDIEALDKMLRGEANA